MLDDAAQIRPSVLIGGDREDLGDPRRRINGFEHLSALIESLPHGDL
jgi:hypothetical protein